MASYCRNCGRELQDGELCNCRGDANGTDRKREGESTNWNEAYMSGTPKGQYYIKAYLPSYDVNMFSILSVIMGINGICMQLGIAPAVLAMVFSFMAKKRVKETDEMGKKMLNIGLILGIVGAAIWAVYIILILAGAVSVASLLSL